MTGPPRRLLDRVCDVLRIKHYAIHTEEAYTHWIRPLRSPSSHAPLPRHGRGGDHCLSHPPGCGTERRRRYPKPGPELVEGPPSSLCSSSTAKCSTRTSGLIETIRAKKPQRLPVALTCKEVRQILDQMTGLHRLMAQLLYGTGMRLMECVRLRVKDIDFARREILIRDGKGEKGRVTMLPESLIAPLQEHLKRVRELRQRDLAAGYGAVYLPYALDRARSQSSSSSRDSETQLTPNGMSRPR